MHEWTQETAENELKELLGELLQLAQNVSATSPPHMRWQLRTEAFLREVFGENSLLYRTFVRLSWRDSGPMLMSYSEAMQGGGETPKRYDIPAYVDSAGKAAGILQAAGDDAA